ncbi:hypothetical protein [Microbispora sp. GKU 823]|uniref:hypothetical protein n=1 Tax=Microbispora sp. GKU 823 TaxID=1652100 RepID=UPI00117CB441|nr:hypothetical protein [Microbispora sp. GKU 823]
MSWTPWTEIDGLWQSAPAAARERTAVVHLFAKEHEPGQNWWHREFPWDDSRWENIGQPYAVSTYGQGAAAAWGEQLMLFVNGGSRLQYVYRDGGWHGWQDLGRPAEAWLASSPAACSWEGRYDVVAVGSDLAMYHRTYANGWSDWENLGGHFRRATPAIASWGPGRLDVFAVGDDRGIHHKWRDGGGWSGWEFIGGITDLGLAACSWGPGRIDVFHTGTDQAVYHKWFENGWSGWENLGGITFQGPTCVAPFSQGLQVFHLGRESTIWRRSFPF